MKQERLKDFMTLGCERELTASINLVDRWAELPKTRRIISVTSYLKYIHICI